MARGLMQNVLQHLRGLAVAPADAGRGDHDLLERFLTQKDETAFEALVRRHGPMVLGVCRRVLGDPDAAEDAFQATFLVFVRKAAAIARRERLGNWLYGVAFHTARAARAASGRRRAKEAKAMPRPQFPEDESWQELLPVLDEELSRLPDKYRTPILLCDLQEKSRRDAARELGLPEGTLSSRLARARALLARRFARRGLTLSAGALAAGLGREAAAALPAALVRATVEAGTLAVAGQAVAVSGTVLTLCDKVLRIMFIVKLRSAALLFAGGLFVVGMGGLAWRQPWASASVPEAPAAKEKAAPPAAAAKPLVRQALEVARTVPDPVAKFRVLLRVAAVQQEAGDAAGAKKTRQEALEAARAIAAGREQVNAMASVALVQLEAGDKPAVPETFRQAERAAAAIADEHEKGNALVFLCRAQAQAGDCDGALRTAAASGAFQTSALTQFAQSLRTTDRPAALKAVRQASERAGAAESRPDRMQALVAIAGALARFGDVDGAIRTAESLGAWADQGLQAVAIAQARGGDPAGARRTADKIGPKDFLAEALLAVALAQAKADQRDAARATLRQVRQLADELRKERAGRPDSRSLAFPGGLAQLEARIAFAQERIGDTEGALRTAAALGVGLQKARALLDVATAQAEAGKTADARATLRTAVAALRDGALETDEKGRSARAARNATLRQITEQQAKVGDVTEAARTADAIVVSYERDLALSYIAPAQAAAGDVKGALATVERLQTEDLKGFTLEGVARALMKAGDEKAARAVAGRQTSPALRTHVYVGMALAAAAQAR
jgi:RNA polymerase sigma factor (sigma-70 family)